LKPSSAEEVAAIVRQLNQNSENFAIKSGGHSPNDYFASIDGGPLISTGNLNEVVYDASTKLAKVGPGLKWEDVISALEPSGVSIVGGRIGNVGVGGYMLGRKYMSPAVG
jgi:FAD/FMN-containing dehydrogenase